MPLQGPKATIKPTVTTSTEGLPHHLEQKGMRIPMKQRATALSRRKAVLQHITGTQETTASTTEAAASHAAVTAAATATAVAEVLETALQAAVAHPTEEGKNNIHKWIVLYKI